MSEYATGAINRPWRTDCVQHPCRDMAIRSRSPGRDRQGNAAPLGQPSPAAGDVPHAVFKYRLGRCRGRLWRMPFHLPWVRTREDRRGTMKAYGTAVALSVSTPALSGLATEARRMRRCRMDRQARRLSR